MEASNYYEDKANRQFLKEKNKTIKNKSEESETKPEKWKDTAKDVGTDLVVGVLGGGLVAAAIGKPAFLVGLAISSYGHYSENKNISALGLGMMASGTMTAINGKTGAPTLSERLNEFKEELKRKLFIDKIFVSDKKSTVNGIETKELVTDSKPAISDFLAMENLAKQQMLDFGGEELNGKVESKKNYYNLEDFDDWRTNGRIY